MVPILKKSLFFFCIFVPFFLYPVHQPKSKKKILILCSTGGYGHMSAAATLKTLLHDQYEFKVIYPIDQFVQSGEQVYNWMIRSGWIRSVNIISRHMAPKVFRMKKKQIESIIRQQLFQETPDLVISLIPFINWPASEAARKVGIPYLLVTTDNDLQHWVHGLQGVSHPNFRVTIGNDLSSRKMLRKRNIPDSAIVTIGLPVKPDFHVKRDPKSLRAQYRIPPHKPVILVMLGGQGGSVTLAYAKTIGLAPLGIHLIACAGKNETLAEDLRSIELHPTNSMTVMEFTDKIPDLMAISDLLITKPGTTTITEAMIMQLPILVDTTSPILKWEQANADLVKHYGVGDSIKNFEELETILREFLYDSELRQKMERSYRQVPCNQFNQAIIPLIRDLL